MEDVGEMIARGPATIGLTLGIELEEALADRRRAIWWVPAGPGVERLLLVGGSRRLRVFAASARWSQVDNTIVERAGFAAPSLNGALAGMVMEAWLAGEPAALHPCDLLAYGDRRVDGRPLSERLALLQQAMGEFRIPGRWFRSRLLAGGPRIAAVRLAPGLRPLARRMAMPYGSGSATDWIMPLR